MTRRRLITCTAKSRRVKPFYVMELLEKAQSLEAKGVDVVHMEVGEPDFPTPPSIRESAAKAIRDGRTFYTHSLGLKELRERIALHYAESRGVRIPPGRVIVTNGTSGAIFLLSAVLLNRGRNLFISDPGYPCYRNFGTLFEARIVTIPVSEESLFQITIEGLEESGANPHLLMISTPSNPTGTVYQQESLARIGAYVSGKGGVMAVDEIYSGLTYAGEAPCALALSEDAVVIDGFSKTYAMTGWRLGWMVVPEFLVRPMQKVAQNVFISAPTIAQHAALMAFDAKAELETMKQTYRARRDYLLPRLEQLGFALPARPDGAFYIYANIERWGMDSMEFTDRALVEAHVAITPGYDFGSYRAGLHVRFSYANTMERIEEGCRRLEKWLESLPAKKAGDLP